MAPARRSLLRKETVKKIDALHRLPLELHLGTMLLPWACAAEPEPVAGFVVELAMETGVPGGGIRRLVAACPTDKK